MPDMNEVYEIRGVGGVSDCIEALQIIEEQWSVFDFSYSAGVGIMKIAGQRVLNVKPLEHEGYTIRKTAV